MPGTSEQGENGRSLNRHLVVDIKDPQALLPALLRAVTASLVSVLILIAIDTGFVYWNLAVTGPNASRLEIAPLAAFIWTGISLGTALSLIWGASVGVFIYFIDKVGTVPFGRLISLSIVTLVTIGLLTVIVAPYDRTQNQHIYWTITMVQAAVAPLLVGGAWMMHGFAGKTLIRLVGFALLTAAVVFYSMDKYGYPNLYPRVHASFFFTTLTLAYATALLVSSPIVSRLLSRPKTLSGFTFAAGLTAISAFLAVKALRNYPDPYARFYLNTTVEYKVAYVLDALTDSDRDGFGLISGVDCDNSDAGKQPLACESERSSEDINCNGLRGAASGMQLFSGKKPISAPLAIENRQKVLFISADAMRAEAVYSGRLDLPHLSSLMRRSHVFESAYTSSPQTGPAMDGVITGRYLAKRERPQWTLDRALQKANFTTDLICKSSPVAFGNRSTQGISFKKTLAGCREFGDRDETLRLAKQTSQLFGRRAEGHRFIWVHFPDPHAPYQADYADKSDFERYDMEVKRVDRAVGIVLDAVIDLDGWIVVFFSDHGEAFSEHHTTHHGSTVFEEQVRVPLLIKLAGQKKQHRIDTPVSLIRIAPTLVSLLDLGEGAFHAPPLPLQAPYDIDSTDPAPVFFFVRNRYQAGAVLYFKVGIQDENLKLILTPELGVYELYDLQTDRGETVNRFSWQNPRHVTMSRRLRSFMDSVCLFE